MATISTRRPRGNPTAGDMASAAATGRRKQIAEILIGTQTAQAWRPDSPVGDQLLGVQVTEPLKGGIEYIIIPPESVEQAYRVFKLSPYLRPIVDALVANVYGAGFTLDPVMDPDDPGAGVEVKRYLSFEKSASAGSYEAEVEEPTDKEIEAELARIRRRISNESVFLEAWFSCCCPDMTYLRLCVLVGQDIEASGTGYVEVLRDSDGFPKRLIWAPAWSISAKPLDEDFINSEESVPLSPIRWSKDTYQRRFRSFVQTDLNGSVVGRYKEYGDPRVMSRRTGYYYHTIEDMQAAPDEQFQHPDGQPGTPLPATELLAFPLPSPVSCTYGQPAWTGVYPDLEGARDVSEENPNLLVDRKVPQMFILVAGGAGIPPKEIEALELKISQNIKQGKKSIYILQAKSARTASGTISPTPTIEIVKTKSEQYQDALGLQYLEHAEAQARHTYRLPPAALGQMEKVTGQDAQLAYQFAESQVYDPRRQIVVDDRINSTLIRDLGVQLVRYRTRSRAPREPNQLATIISTLMNSGVLTPDEGRKLAGDIFNLELKELEGIWSKLPTKLLLAMLQTKNQLVAAALLGSETERDIIARLQAALVGQLEAAPPAAPAQGSSNGQQGNRPTGSSIPSKSQGVSGISSEGALPLPVLPKDKATE